MTDFAALFLAEASLTSTATWATNRFESTCPRVIAAARRLGAGERTAVALAEAMPRPQGKSRNCFHRSPIDGGGEAQWFCGEQQHAVDETVAAIEEFAGARMTNALLCLNAGMDASEAAEHLREGRPMRPVRLMAALR